MNKVERFTIGCLFLLCAIAQAQNSPKASTSNSPEGVKQGPQATKEKEEPTGDPAQERKPLVAGRTKSPFMIPDELYLTIKKKQTETAAPGGIDLNVDVRYRWPLKEYRLIGVIWDTKRPKAMITDGFKAVHVFRERDLIANAGGYVAEISNGEVIVVENGTEIKMKLNSVPGNK